MTLCICGNELSQKPKFKFTIQPCRCDAPGPGRRQGRVLDGIHEFCGKKQYQDRKRLGLPLMTDTELGVRSRWHSG